jgi:hypothetical protein
MRKGAAHKMVLTMASLVHNVLVCARASTCKLANDTKCHTRQCPTPASSIDITISHVQACSSSAPVLAPGALLKQQESMCEHLYTTWRTACLQDVGQADKLAAAQRNSAAALPCWPLLLQLSSFSGQHLRHQLYTGLQKWHTN